jgi:hypothetical protein
VRDAIVVTLGAALLCGAAKGASSAEACPRCAGPATFATALTGGGETFGAATPHSGQIVARFTRDARGVDRLVYDIGLSKGTQVTYVTLQCAPVGKAGPVVAVLAKAKGWTTDRDLLRRHGAIGDASIVPTRATATCPIRIASLQDVRAAAVLGAVYVNVYAYAYPAGEVRGQLKVLGN